MNELLRDAIKLFETERGIPAELLIEKLNNAVATAARKEFGVKGGIFCELDDEYEFHLSRRLDVVEEVEEPDSQVTLEEAREEKPDAELGDVLVYPLEFKNLGRIAAQSVKHIMRQGIRDIEQERVLKEMQGKNKDIVSAKIVSVNPLTGDATVEINGRECLLPKKDQIPNERLLPGSYTKVYIADVKSTEKGPKVMLSRVNPGIVRRLFEQEVPEVYDGSVEIRSIAREAGSRTKIAVSSKDENVEPIGSCIGPKGSRINQIIDLMGGEKIDVVKYSDNPVEFISAALSPAQIVSVEILDEETRSARVTVPENQLSLAIGNKGQNARLAVRLTGWKIDIKPYFGEYKPMIQL
jgi:N utilization substance protein A